MTRLSEDQIIEILQKGAMGKRQVREDVEVFRHGHSSIVVAVDTLVQSTDVPPGMKMHEISRKAVAACVSDFAAKGVRPRFGTVSVTVPRGFSKRQLVELSRGFQRASREFKVKILGGDTNEGMELSITVSLYGTADGIVPRRGAKTGDRIFVTGHFGGSAAGLHLLLNKPGRARHYAKYRNAFCSPKPKLEFCTRAKRYLSSAMDSSDGLAKTLHEMSKQSRKKFVLTRLPSDKTLESFARKNRMSAEDLVLFGGEEYEAVFTVPERSVSRLLALAKKCRVRPVEIGQAGRGSGVELQTEYGRKSIPNKGWTHLD